MEEHLFRKFQKLVYEKAGISLSDKKKSLVEGRVAKRLRKLKIKTYKEYLKYLLQDKTEVELVYFINVISTNYTYFFREEDHFEILEKYTTSLLKQGRNRFRMWSAASSTGEEPYSIVFTLSKINNFLLNNDFKLLATDISTDVLDKAKQGIYIEKQIEKLTKKQISDYFIKKKDPISKEKLYIVKKIYKQPIVFKRLNLAIPPYPMKGPLDIIFCRNVMIYFDNTVKQRLVSEFERLLAPSGLLIIGHSETLNGLNHNFKIINPSIYKKLG